jgi:uracil phosphoribosyltransferase
MLYELNTPLSTHLINRLREKQTTALEFRQILKYLTLLLADAALKPSDLHPKKINTWSGEESIKQLKEDDIIIVTVLRAGLPMLEAIMDLLPQAKAGFLGIKRDETTHKSKLYYDRLPECTGKNIILVDPMVATGGSLIDAIEILKDRGASKITTLNIIGAPEGVDLLTKRYPQIDIYIAQIDKKLNKDKYIIPGLGDAGDRSYNTIE